jgi:hypothetical protein
MHTRAEPYPEGHGAGDLVRAQGEVWQLDPDVYDLRMTLRYMAITMTETLTTRSSPARRPDPLMSGLSGGEVYIEQPFRTAFYRAARSLVERGLLIRLDDDATGQIRFVSLRPDLEARYAEEDAR